MQSQGFPVALAHIMEKQWSLKRRSHPAASRALSLLLVSGQPTSPYTAASYPQAADITLIPCICEWNKEIQRIHSQLECGTVSASEIALGGYENCCVVVQPPDQFLRY